MKIAFVAPFGLGQKTTIWARTLPLAKELTKLGHQVTILIPPWDTPADSDKRWQDEGVSLINVAIHGGLLPTTLRTLHEIYKIQPQIIHIVKPRAHAGIVQWLLWQLRRWNIAQFAIRNSQFVILLDLDDWEQAWAEINHYPRLVAKFLAWQEEWGIRHADGITVASRWLEERVRVYAPHTPVLYLPNGVVLRDKERGRQGERAANGDSQFAVLYLTRYVEVEPEWLVRFSSSLHAKIPGAQLIIAGEPLQPGREKLFQSALESVENSAAPLDSRPAIGNLPSAISFLGKVSPQDIEKLYASADCAIFPSATTILQQAKCSVRLATTLLHGVPVIASEVGEQANYGGDGAARLVANDASPELFAQAVVEVLLDPAAQSAMLAQARQRLETDYRWSLFGNKLEGCYRRLIHEN